VLQLIAIGLGDGRLQEGLSRAAALLDAEAALEQHGVLSPLSAESDSTPPALSAGARAEAPAVGEVNSLFGEAIAAGADSIQFLPGTGGRGRGVLSRKGRW